LRFLNLHKHFGSGKYLVGGIYDASPDLAISLIPDSRSSSCALFDEHLMSAVNQFAHTRGDQTDAVFMNFGLPGHTYPHQYLHMSLIELSLKSQKAKGLEITRALYLLAVCVLRLRL
jgi:hypothetical protein